ncbi:MAG: hypothetical protein AB7T31_12530 [Gemmatimonadales bacterium]
MGYLIAALAATAGGPLLYRLLHERPGLTRYVDRFVYVAVPLLVALEILPLSWERRSVIPLLAVGAGLLLPTWIGSASQALRRGTEAVALAVVLTGLLLHSFFDGAGLATVPAAGATGAPSGAAFGLAVVTHRWIEGLVVWWIVRPDRGVKAAVLAVGGVLLTTTFGFALGRELLSGGSAGQGTTELYQALVAGSLLHVIFHQGRHAHAHAHAGDGTPGDPAH